MSSRWSGMKSVFATSANMPTTSSSPPSSKRSNPTVACLLGFAQSGYLTVSGTGDLRLLRHGRLDCRYPIVPMEHAGATVPDRRVALLRSWDVALVGYADLASALVEIGENR